ncbi:hypothetical protein RhiJN_18211 [Ceratobasidium sp. AG-Ba]|nr:hypothetical protein RhiJN_18211 [Ceratobasidium sp. AG-Ba]
MSYHQAISLEPPARKTGGLWSYILPPAPSSFSLESEPDASLPPPSSTSTVLPATGPSDRSVLSVRLMLGDAKAALQQLSDRVERIADESANARREIAEAGRGVEEAQGGILKQIQSVVKQAVSSIQEANIAHTSPLEAASARIANLEASLAAQAKGISDLSQACTFNQLGTSELMDRVMQTHSAVLTLSPVIPLLQAIPTEIANAHLGTKNTIERLQTESLRTARDTRIDLQNLSEEQTRATLSVISQLFGARDRAWKELLDDIVGCTRKDLEKCREDWSNAFSAHRREVCDLLSDHLANSAHGPRPAVASTSPSMNTGAGVTQDSIIGGLSHALPDERGQLRSDTPVGVMPSTSRWRKKSSEADSPLGTEQGASSETLDEPYDLGGSISRIGCGVGSVTNRYHAEPKSVRQQIHTQDNIHQHLEIDQHPPCLLSTGHQPEPSAEAESQSTALSSVPELGELIEEPPDSQVHEIEHHAQDAGGTRLFGALNQPERAHSLNIGFVAPGSPQFSAHRQSIIVEKPSSYVPTASTRPRVAQRTDPRVPSATTVGLPSLGTIPPGQAPTLGHPSPQSVFSYFTSPLAPGGLSQKRGSSSEKQGPAKRQKTRILMDLQDCESDEE